MFRCTRSGSNEYCIGCLWWRCFQGNFYLIPSTFFISWLFYEQSWFWNILGKETLVLFELTLIFLEKHRSTFWTPQILKKKIFHQNYFTFVLSFYESCLVHVKVKKTKKTLIWNSHRNKTSNESNACLWGPTRLP